MQDNKDDLYDKVEYSVKRVTKLIILILASVTAIMWAVMEGLDKLAGDDTPTEQVAPDSSTVDSTVVYQ